MEHELEWTATDIARFINFGILVVWFSGIIISFFLLYKWRLSATATVLWVMVILFFPLVGALIFLIFGKRFADERQTQA
ncbi:MAG: hypothetical protein GY874_18200 [Desulfobacteraceae bacterium]|nr:hypothetical protein [Desulfobacteraceae bacterium]